MDAEDIITSEAMTPEMRLVVLSNGETKFVSSNEEYSQLMAAGLILGTSK
jgi:hypothetical protein